MAEREPWDLRIHRVFWFAGFAWITTAVACTCILLSYESGSASRVELAATMGSIGILCLVAGVAGKRISAFDDFRLYGTSTRAFKAPVISDATPLQRALFTRDITRLAVDADGLRVLRRSEYARACAAAFLMCCLLPTKMFPATGFVAVGILAALLWLAVRDRGPCRSVTPIPWAQVRGVVETPSGAAYFFFEGAPMERMELTLNPAQRRGLMEAVGDRCPVMCLPTVAGPRTDLRRRKPAIHAWTARELDEALEKLRDLES